MKNYLFDWREYNNEEAVECLHASKFIIFDNFLSAIQLEYFKSDLNQELSIGVDHYEKSNDVFIKDKRSTYKLLMLLQSNAYLNRIQNLLQKTKIEKFIGRFTLNNKSTNCIWHNDYIYGRKLGISIAIDASFSEGGEFGVKYNDIVVETKLNPGQAILFLIEKEAFHKVNTVKCEGKRINFAGWFINESEKQD